MAEKTVTLLSSDLDRNTSPQKRWTLSTLVRLGSDFEPAGTERWLQRVSIDRNVVPPRIRFWFGGSSTDTTLGTNDHDLVDAWEDAAAGVTFAQDSDSFTVPGPNHSSNDLTDSAERYLWQVPSSQSTEVAAWISLFDGTADASVTFKYPSDDTGTVADPLEGDILTEVPTVDGDLGSVEPSTELDPLVGNIETEVPAVDGDLGSVEPSTELDPLEGDILTEVPTVDGDLSSEALLSLQDFDEQGLEVVVLGLFTASANSEFLYREDQNLGSIADSDSDIEWASGQNITRIRRRDSGTTIRLHDNPSTESFTQHDLENEGWKAYIQTGAGRLEFEDSGNIGDNFANWTTSTADVSIFNDISEGDRFILAIARDEVTTADPLVGNIETEVPAVDGDLSRTEPDLGPRQGSFQIYISIPSGLSIDATSSEFQVVIPALKGEIETGVPDISGNLSALALFADPLEGDIKTAVPETSADLSRSLPDAPLAGGIETGVPTTDGNIERVLPDAMFMGDAQTGVPVTEGSLERSLPLAPLTSEIGVGVPTTSGDLSRSLPDAPLASDIRVGVPEARGDLSQTLPGAPLSGEATTGSVSVTGDLSAERLLLLQDFDDTGLEVVVLGLFAASSADEFLYRPPNLGSIVDSDSDLEWKPGQTITRIRRRDSGTTIRLHDNPSTETFADISVDDRWQAYVQTSEGVLLFPILEDTQGNFIEWSTTETDLSVFNNISEDDRFLLAVARPLIAPLASDVDTEIPTTEGQLSRDLPAVPLTGNIETGTPTTNGALERTLPDASLAGNVETGIPTTNGALERTLPDAPLAGNVETEVPEVEGSIERMLPDAMFMGDVQTGVPIIEGTLERSLPLAPLASEIETGVPTLDGNLVAIAPAPLAGSIETEVPEVDGNLETKFALKGSVETESPEVGGSLSADIPLLLSDFDTYGLEVVILGLIEASSATEFLYRLDQNLGSIVDEDSDLEWLPAQTITRIRRRVNGTQFRIHDNPSVETFTDAVGTGGWTLTIQTQEGSIDYSVFGNPGANNINWSTTETDLSVVNNISVGDRFLIAISRSLTADLASDVETGIPTLEGQLGRSLPPIPLGGDIETGTPDVEGVLSRTLPDASLAGNVETESSEVEGSLSIALPSGSVSGNVETEVPSIEGSLERTLPDAPLSGDVATSVPGIDGRVSRMLPGAMFNGNIETGTLVVEGNLGASLPGGGLDGSIETEVPGITGYLRVTPPPAPLAGNIVTGAPTLVGDLDSDLPSADFSGNIATGALTLVGDLERTLPDAPLASDIAVGAPEINGGLERTLPGAPLAGEVETGVPTARGTLDTSLPSASLTSRILTEVPVVEGSLERTLPAAPLEGNIEVGVPAVDGRLARMLPGAMFNGDIETGAPTISGNLEISLPSASFSGNIETEVSIVVGSLRRVLPSAPLAGNIETEVPEVEGDLSRSLPAAPLAGNIETEVPEVEGDLPSLNVPLLAGEAKTATATVRGNLSLEFFLVADQTSTLTSSDITVDTDSITVSLSTRIQIDSELVKNGETAYLVGFKFDASGTRLSELEIHSSDIATTATLTRELTNQVLESVRLVHSNEW